MADGKVQIITLKLPVELHEELRVLSFRLKRPYSHLALEWIAEGYAKEAKKLLESTAA